VNCQHPQLRTGENQLDFWIEDCNGYNLEQVFLDTIPDRRNGLPSHAYSYSYDGIVHVFPLFNNIKDDCILMTKINQLMVYPYTYISAFGELDATGSGNFDSTYGEWSRPEVITGHDPDRYQWSRIHHYYISQENLPEPGLSALRVTFTGITTIPNNGADANKEFDIQYGVYGIWTKEGIKRRL
jgi:hypothetical protein